MLIIYHRYVHDIFAIINANDRKSKLIIPEMNKIHKN